MEQAEGDGIAPIHGENLQERMDIPPVFNGHEDTVIVFALVEDGHIIEIEVLNLYLRVVFPQVIPEKIHIVAPVPVHQHQLFPI